MKVIKHMEMNTKIIMIKIKDQKNICDQKNIMTNKYFWSKKIWSTNFVQQKNLNQRNWSTKNIVD